MPSTDFLVVGSRGSERRQTLVPMGQHILPGEYTLFDPGHGGHAIGIWRCLRVEWVRSSRAMGSAGTSLTNHFVVFELRLKVDKWEDEYPKSQTDCLRTKRS
jgi:hypothetical protein